MTTTTEAAVSTTFADLDPRTLLIEANVRAEAHLDAQFIASIREHGVLMPVLVQRTAEGLHVRAGQRRTLGAIEADRATIPARIVEGDEDQARRILEQMAENDDRRDMDDADRAAAYQQLALLGVSAAQIARKRGVAKETVQAGITVAGSAAATAALGEHDLTLEDAALFAEFEDDEEATATLARNVGSSWGGGLAHTAQRIRDQRAEAAAVAVITEALTEQGVRIIARASGYYDKPTYKEVGTLRNKGEKAALSPTTHASCPGHAAYIDKDGTPVAVFVCTDPKANSHLKIAEPQDPNQEKTPVDEKARAARREVIENNKAWRSAEVVRREWLAAFTARKSAPKGAAEFVARFLASDVYMLSKAAEKRHTLAAQWLGLRLVSGQYGPPRADFDALTAKASPARAQVITLVLILAAIEENTGTHTWRQPGARTTEYFQIIETWGYALSEVEQIVRDAK